MFNDYCLKLEQQEDEQWDIFETRFLILFGKLISSCPYVCLYCILGLGK